MQTDGLQSSTVLPIGEAQYRAFLRNLQSRGGLDVRADEGKFVIQKFADEGSSTPFMARVFFAPLKLADALDGDTEPFKEAHQLLITTLMEIRDAAIRQSGGQVEIESEIGLGTSVALLLPRATECEAQDELGVDEATGAGGAEDILVVEDDDLVRRQAVVNLKALGYRVTDARDGIEALAILKSGRRFDLLFTDVVMPRGMNGRQLAEAAAELCPDMPVLYTSGYAENHIIHQGRIAPGLTLLNKPYNSADLAKKVRGVLDGSAEI